MSKSFSKHTEPRLQDLFGEPIVHLISGLTMSTSVSFALFLS